MRLRLQEQKPCSATEQGVEARRQLQRANDALAEGINSDLGEMTGGSLSDHQRNALAAASVR